MHPYAAGHLVGLVHPLGGADDVFARRGRRSAQERPALHVGRDRLTRQGQHRRGKVHEADRLICSPACREGRHA